jgi:hypothetical protein
MDNLYVGYTLSLNQNKPIGSWAWKYFDNLAESHIHKQCVKCRKVVNVTSSMSTSHMIEHIQRAHGDIFLKEDKKKREEKKAGTKVIHAGQSKIDKHVVSATTVDESIVDFVVMTFQPFSTVDHPSFVKMMRVSNPAFKQFGRKALVSKIRNEYELLKSKLKGVLQGQYFALTTVSFNMRIYLSHY